MVNYIICTTPRSGSYLLCDILSNINELGYPKEYLTRQSIEHYKKAWGLSDFDTYLNFFPIKASTPNNVSGIKIMANLWPNISKEINRVRRYGSIAPSETLFRFFPKAKYIFLIRKNIIAQAISLYMASSTGLWAIRNEDQQNLAKTIVYPGFNFYQIWKHQCMIDQSNHVWDRFFSQNGITPLTLFFEDFLSDKEKILNQIYSFLEIEPFGALKLESSMKKQSMPINKQFENKYNRQKNVLEPLYKFLATTKRIALSQKTLEQIFF